MKEMSGAQSFSQRASALAATFGDKLGQKTKHFATEQPLAPAFPQFHIRNDKFGNPLYKLPKSKFLQQQPPPPFLAPLPQPLDHNRQPTTMTPVSHTKGDYAFFECFFLMTFLGKYKNTKQGEH